MTKIVVLDGYTENPGDLSWSGLEALGSLIVYDRTPSDQIIERIRDADYHLHEQDTNHCSDTGSLPSYSFHWRAGYRLQCRRLSGS